MQTKNKKTAIIQGDITEDTCLYYFKQLWNKQNLDKDQINWKWNNIEHSIINLEELEGSLKLTKNGSSSGFGNIISSVIKEFKLKLLNFLNEIYAENTKWIDRFSCHPIIQERRRETHKITEV